MVRRGRHRREGPSGASGPDGRRAGTRRAIRAALAIAGTDAVRLVLTGDRGQADRIIEGLGAVPPPDAQLRVAARPGLVAVDATGAGERSLRRLARALPRRRPVDGIGCVTGLAGDGDERGVDSASRLARLLRTRAALHLVVPAEHDRPIFVTCREPDRAEVSELARDLRERLVREWLHAGPGSGSARPNPGPDGKMEERLAASLERACRQSLALSSLAWGGCGLGAAVASAWDRTIPDERARRWNRAGAAALAAGVTLAILGGFAQANRAVEVGRALSVVAPALRGAGADPGAFAGESKARRYARAAQALAEAAGPSASSPLSALHPASEALRELSVRTVRDAVVRPARRTVRHRMARDLGPGTDPDEWLERAGGVLARAGEGGSHATANLLAGAYGGSEAKWMRALAGADPGPPSAAGSLAGAGERGFVATVAAWAKGRYMNGTLLVAARRTARAREWRERLEALRAFESALRTREARGLASDGPDPELERIRARARGLLGEPTVERALAEAVRVREDALAELDGLRLAGDVPLVGIEPDGTRGLGAAARRLLAGYESMAGEDFLAYPGGGAGGGAPAYFSAGTVLASLERFDRRLAEVRTGDSIHGLLGPELETAALDEAARRIESGSHDRLATEERAAIGAVERLARARGAHPAADRIAAVLERLDAARGRTALRAIEEDDPLGVEFDAETDRHAILDRVTAGIERLDALYRGAPAAVGFRWRELGRALRGYRNADPSSVLTRMVDRARDFARRESAACPDEYPRIDAGRPPAGYPDRAYAAFARRLDAVCREAAAREAADADAALRSFYREHLAWRWPYSNRPGAPVVPASTLVELLRRAGRRGAEALPADLSALVSPWRLDRHGDPVLDLAVEWRTEPDRERNAEHLAAYRLEGMKALANGGRAWRYGDPLRAHLRLAKDSPLRFEGGAAEVSIPVEPGRWVARIVAGAPAAAFTIEIPVAGAGAAESIRLSALVSKRRPAESGRPAPTVVVGAAGDYG